MPITDLIFDAAQAASDIPYYAPPPVQPGRARPQFDPFEYLDEIARANREGRDFVPPTANPRARGLMIPATADTPAIIPLPEMGFDPFAQTERERWAREQQYQQNAVPNYGAAVAPEQGDYFNQYAQQFDPTRHQQPNPYVGPNGRPQFSPEGMQQLMLNQQAAQQNSQQQWLHGMLRSGDPRERAMAQEHLLRVQYSEAVLNQQEQMRLATLERAISALDSARELTPEQRQMMRTALRTNMQPLAARRAMAETLGQELQNRTRERLLTQNVQMENNLARLRDRPVTTMENGVMFSLGRDGDWTPVSSSAQANQPIDHAALRQQATDAVTQRIEASGLGAPNPQEINEEYNRLLTTVQQGRIWGPQRAQQAHARAQGVVQTEVNEYRNDIQRWRQRMDSWRAMSPDAADPRLRRPASPPTPPAPPAWLVQSTGPIPAWAHGSVADFFERSSPEELQEARNRQIGRLVDAERNNVLNASGVAPYETPSGPEGPAGQPTGAQQTQIENYNALRMEIRGETPAPSAIARPTDTERAAIETRTADLELFRQNRAVLIEMMTQPVGMLGFTTPRMTREQAEALATRLINGDTSASARAIWVRALRNRPMPQAR